MFRSLIWIVSSVAFVLAVGTADAAAVDAKYIGAKKCGTCHKKELIGNQNGVWAKMKHAKAYNTLKSEKAIAIAKEKGIAGAPSEAAECLKCHVTAYEANDSMFAKGRLAVEDGVQCESCHGPGSLYKKKKTMADHAASVAAGMREPGKDEKICAKCHNSQSPTWDAAKGFNYEKSKQEIAHPIPEDVKGRYIEVEKQRRAEKEAGGQ